MTVGLAPSLSSRRWLPELEVLRSASFLFIVFSHAVWTLHDLPHSAQTMAVFSAALAVTRPALPVFMIVSALLIARRVSQDAGADQERPVRRLMAGYVVWTVVYVLALRVLDGSKALSPGELLSTTARALLLGEGCYHLWFVLIAIQIYWLAPALARFLMIRERRARAYWLLVAFALQIALLGQVWGPWAGTQDLLGRVLTTYFDRLLPFWGGYVVLGVVLGLDYEGLVERLEAFRLPLWALYLVSAAAVAYLSFSRTLSLSGAYQPAVDISRVIQPWIVPFQALTAVAWLLAARLVRSAGARFFAAVGAASYGAYLVHALVLHMLLLSLYAAFPKVDAGLATVGLTVATAAGSVLFAWLVGFVTVPLGAALGGAARARLSRLADDGASLPPQTDTPDDAEKTAAL